ncbi:MAG: DUF1929 domain-containing protein [Planctomycetes bacterium]|nr:DUF1929 domain-containing protein [Planctomycetota bacterium]MCC7169014.1 DUF1929 domain-containing protein [Planctomycetota bacterium]
MIQIKDTSSALDTLGMHREIAHAVIMPNAATPKVLLWALHNCGVSSEIDDETIINPRTYLWVDGVPPLYNLTVKNFLSTPNASNGPWIMAKGSGTVHLFNGEVSLTGPTNYFPDCHGGVELNGSRYALRYSTSAGWTLTSATALNHAHWYSSAVVAADGSVLVIGHGGNPITTSGTPPDPGPDGRTTFEWYRFNPTNGTYAWDSPAHDNYTSGADLEILAYPHLHMLAHSGEIFFADATVGTGSSQTLAWALLDLNASPQPTWTLTPESSEPIRSTTNTVHFVYLDSNDVYHDAVYMIGGSPRAICSSTVVAYKDVWRMVDPSSTSSWEKSSGATVPPSPHPPELNTARYFSNSVILLDGSILTIGGDTSYSGGDCANVLTPERLCPPETFASPSSSWDNSVAAHAKARDEHAVALLLADGRVFCAGGKGDYQHGSTPSYPSYHSAEIFSPPYMYSASRPVITSTGTNNGRWAADGGATTVYAQLSGTDTPEKVALLRLGSVTHNVDMGQRWVEVEI